MVAVIVAPLLALVSSQVTALFLLVFLESFAIAVVVTLFPLVVLEVVLLVVLVAVQHLPIIVAVVPGCPLSIQGARAQPDRGD
jgi:hypothetical protein